MANLVVVAEKIVGNIILEDLNSNTKDWPAGTLVCTQVNKYNNNNKYFLYKTITD